MLKFLSLTCPEQPAYQEAARTIYEQAFEPEEKVPFSGLWAAATAAPGQAGVQLWGAVQGGVLQATAWFCSLIDEGLGYLGYLAVAPQARGQGMGGRLLQAVLEEMENCHRQATGQPPSACFWEVRCLEDAPDEAEHHLRQRRITFYQRFEAQTLPVFYVCPPVAPEQPPVRFTLMARTCPPGQPIGGELQRRMVLAALVNMEGESMESLYVQQALDSIR